MVLSAIIGDGAPRRDGAQDETIQVSCGPAACYLFILILYKDNPMFYVCISFRISVVFRCACR